MLIELNDIRKVFNQGKHNEFSAIRGISLQIEPNKVTCLKGASGSGKTTLLSMIGCLSRPTSGRITLGEQNISGLPERFLQYQLLFTATVDIPEHEYLNRKTTRQQQHQAHG